MLAINMDDVLNVLNTVAPYLIGFAVVLVLAIIVMIACQKLGKAKKYLIRSQTGLAILLPSASLPTWWHSDPCPP